MSLTTSMQSHLFRYTEHSTVGLAQQWDQLDQLGMRMQHNLEQQIQAWYVYFQNLNCSHRSFPFRL